MKHFLDTYALVEIVRGTAAFEPYLDGGVTAMLHVYELHVAIAREHGEGVADEIFRAHRGSVIDPTDDEILAASRFKRAHPRRRLSYADALGYAMARNRNLTFVTGDKGFEGIEGVTFVR